MVNILIDSSQRQDLDMEEMKVTIEKNTEISVDQPCNMAENNPFQSLLRHDYIQIENGIVTPRALMGTVLHIIFY